MDIEDDLVGWLSPFIDIIVELGTFDVFDKGNVFSAEGNVINVNMEIPNPPFFVNTGDEESDKKGVELEN